MAFSYDSKDVGAALGAAIENVRALEERPADFGYRNNTPIRFAGAQMMKNLGTNGEFGFRTNDKEDKNSQEYLKRFTQQWTSGPFAPEVMGTAEVA